MKKLYIDIDGVLLSAKNAQRPPYGIEFIDYITTKFDCYWLTTHCKEGEKCIRPLIQYLSLYYDIGTIRKMKVIKPTSWVTSKTEAIDIKSDFYWLDDYIFDFEKKLLEKHNRLNRWIKVNLDNTNELKRIIEILDKQ